MTSRRFSNHEQAQAWVNCYDNGTKALISYTTTVIMIDEEGWLKVNGLYSRTTIKHIGWFMREMGFSYQTAKTLYLNNKEMNIFTGEVRDL